MKMFCVLGVSLYENKMNDYKDLAKKIYYINKNKTILKKKTLIGYNNLHRFDQETNLNKYYSVLKKYLI